MLLVGRAAEQVVFDHISTGAADDLGKATDIARSMAMHYAMVPELGNVAYDTEPGPLPGLGGSSFSRRAYSEVTAREIDSAIRAIVDKAFERTRAILIENRATLGAGAARLLDKETLVEPELSEIFASVRLPDEHTSSSDARAPHVH